MTEGTENDGHCEAGKALKYRVDLAWARACCMEPGMVIQNLGSLLVDTAGIGEAAAKMFVKNKAKVVLAGRGMKGRERGQNNYGQGRWERCTIVDQAGLRANGF